MKMIHQADRHLLMLGLGFSSGLPISMVMGTLSARLAFSDIDIRTIGLMLYLTLPYTLKVLWAPFFSYFDPPFFKRNKRLPAWLITTQICIVVCLVVLAQSDPKHHFLRLIIFTFGLAFFSASQDILIDGWRILTNSNSDQGKMGALSNFGYQCARFVSGAGCLYLASVYSWSTGYYVVAAAMCVGLMISIRLYARSEPKAYPQLTGTSFWSLCVEPLINPFTDLKKRYGSMMLAIFFIVAVYRLPEFLAGAMAMPLYHHLNYTLTQIALVSKIYGVLVGMFSALLCGVLIKRFGWYPIFLLGAPIGTLANLMFAWLALYPPETWRLVLAISVDNFCGAFAGMALITFMSVLSKTQYALVQYAILTSLFALAGKCVAGTSGYAVSWLGYPAFYSYVSLLSIPLLILCLATRNIATLHQSTS